MGLAIDRIDLESEAQWLRRCLAARLMPVTQVLCILRFFERIIQAPVSRLEPYLRAFIPNLARITKICDPSEFFPEDLEILSSIVELLSTQSSDVVSVQDRTAIASFFERLSSWINEVVGPAHESKHAPRSDTVTCLFVEHYPEIGLNPRGRIVRLTVLGSAAPSDARSGIVTVHNPVEKPDDSFLNQARQSVSVARDYLGRRNAMSPKRQHRIDFTLDSTGARLTGDSLGLALAVGAAATISRVEALRERLAVSPDVAFSGALSSMGQIEPIDRQGLELKVHRAFFSSLQYLVVPRKQLSEAGTYLRTLETKYPNRKLELVGEDHFAGVVEDTRLVARSRLGLASYAARQVKRRGRSPWVEVPVLAVLATILIWLLLPILDRQPVGVRIIGSGFEVVNSHAHVLWKKSYPCEALHDYGQSSAVLDLDNDGHNEVLFGPDPAQASPISGLFYIYNYRGDSLRACDCIARGEYWGDTTKIGEPALYYGPKVDIVRIDHKLRIITSIENIYPARGHIKMWDSAGNQLGWYVNSGAASYQFLSDIDGDGIDELICTGFQNRMLGQTVFVLPAGGFHGVSPPYLKESYGYDLSWVKHGNQLRYLFFPPTDIGKLDLPSDYQPGGELRRTSGNEFDFNVTESREIHGETVSVVPVDYLLSQEFRVTRVLLSDVFIKRYRELLASHSIPSIPLEDYPDSLCDRVRYWKDSGWVTGGSVRAPKR
jgi:hypothetical protein